MRLGTIRKSDAVDSVRLAVISNCILCRLEIVVATIGATFDIDAGIFTGEVAR